MQLWYAGLVEMKRFPLFGIGAGMYPDFVDGRVAHNSFVHAFVELGIFGGVIFLGAFWFARALVHA